MVPFLVLFLLFFLMPIVYALVQSTLASRSSGLGLGPATVTFVGLDNYKVVLADPEFLASIGRLTRFTLINVPVTVGLALFFALVLDVKSVPGRGLFRVLFFVPYAIPGVVGGILWAFLYSPSLSPYQQILDALGGGQVDFLSPSTVLFSIANITIWGYTGYNMLILTSALNALPEEQFEAAKLDGCGRLREAILIKIPQLMPALVMTVLFAVIGSLQLFNEPLILSAITKSVSSTYTPNLMAYSEAFNNNNSYIASAISVLLALITGVCSVIFLTATRKRSGL